ncbi:hypothetical protein D5086_019833 [Populus alba]|uniref:Uncharacterized protein n=1 Tax=Populus alba TaxID=43335 RepID=A0ACC4BIP8_POPAL
MEETGRENMKLKAAQNSNSTQGWYHPAGLWTATIPSKAFRQQSPFHRKLTSHPFAFAFTPLLQAQNANCQNSNSISGWDGNWYASKVSAHIIPLFQ